MDNIIQKIKESELTQRIIKMVVFGIGGAAFSKGIMMLINIIVARLVSEEDYGIYSLMNNTIQTFTLFASAGIGVTLTRYIAMYKEKDKNLAGILIKTLSIFNFITSIIISIAIFIFADKLSIILSKEVDVSAFLRITAFSVFFTSVSLLWQCVLQGFEKFKDIAIVQVINNVIILFISIIITKTYKIQGAIISLLILQILNYIMMYWISKKQIKDSEITLKIKFNGVIKEAIIRYALPALLSSIFVIPLLWFTNITFTKVHGYEEFAYFSVCLQWLTIINYLPQQLNQARPIYTQLYEDKNYIEFKKVIKKMITFAMTFSVVISIIFCLLNQFILGSYGANYKSVKISFIIMIFTSIVMNVQTQFGAVYQAIGKFWTCLILNMTWAISFLIIFFILLKYSVIGYAMTYLLSYFIYAVISYITFYKIIKKLEKENI